MKFFTSKKMRLTIIILSACCVLSVIYLGFRIIQPDLVLPGKDSKISGSSESDSPAGRESSLPESQVPDKRDQEKDIFEKDFPLVLSTTLRRSDTIYEILLSAGVSPDKTYHIVKALGRLFNPKRCRPGDLIEVKKSPQGSLIFKYVPNSLEYFLVEESEEGSFSARKEEVPRRRVLAGTRLVVQSSVYQSMRAAKLSPELVNRFADIFAWQIDFLTDPRKGDVLEFVWEYFLSPEGKIILEGRILAARYINSGHNYTGVFFRDEESHSDYYTSQGESLRLSFLRSPLHYRRISSYFSWHRFHPILKIYRPHLGIDYAAPTGTPVSAIGEGEVIFAGWKGGYGRFVKIKHPGSIITTYGHLSRYARGIKRGIKVKQGQVIGYVGSSGLSTGPHLDFRVVANGRFVNFLKMKLPRAEPVKSAYFEEFKQVSEKYLAHLDTLKNYPPGVHLFSEGKPHIPENMDHSIIY